MNSEIGSNFWVNPYEVKDNNKMIPPSLFVSDYSDFIWLSTGRSAINFLIKTIEERKFNKDKRILLPSFTCDTVIKPFIDAKYRISYYNVDTSLNVKSSEIIKEVLNNNIGIVYIHRYFGFDTITNDTDLYEYLHNNGIIIIEDCTQCLFSNLSNIRADYILGSIRKWSGVPDGGFAVCKEGHFTNKPFKYDKILESAKLKASYAKYKYLFENIGNKFDFLEDYKKAEDILDNQQDIYCICEMSIKIHNSLDIGELIRKRRNNFVSLLEHFPKRDDILPLFKSLPINVVPLYFPLIVENRKSTQEVLVNNRIYAPVVWPKNDYLFSISETVNFLYEHLLCVPIDQRYDEEDMLRIIRVIKTI